MKDITFKEENIKFDYRVAAIIESDGKFLFQQMEGDANLTLVGGRASLMKTSKESIIRELKEELGYEATEEQLELVQIAENFFDYKDKDNKLQQVHSILFIYKMSISSDEEITKKKDFCVLDKPQTKLFWIDKKEARNASILPKIAKRLLEDSTFSYGINDDTLKENK